MEVDSLTSRIRNIKQSLQRSSNKRLRKRLICENKIIFERVCDIYEMAKLINNMTKENLNFSSLLFEKSKRALNETKSESNLFFI